MAAPARVPEHILEDRIPRLLKLSDVPEMKQILEEAAQLSVADQHTEAGAFVEKAEEIGSAPSQQPAGESFAARMAIDLGSGLTQVLIRTMQALERHISMENERLGAVFGHRLDKLQSSVESLQPLHQRIDQLVQNGAMVQGKFDELAASHARLDTDLVALRIDMDQLSASMSGRINEACGRIDAQGREISAIQANAWELASKMALAAERLERHASAIRSLHDSHRERTQVFGQMSELLHRLDQGCVSTEGSTL